MAMSKSARKKIGEAQRKRWAEWKAKRAKMANDVNVQETIMQQNNARTVSQQFKDQADKLRSAFKQCQDDYDTLSEISQEQKVVLERNQHIFKIFESALALRKTL